MGRIKIGNVRPTIEYLNQYFAPAWYGLGGSAIRTDDLNTNMKCGWYSFGTNCANRPFDFGVALSLNRYGVETVQIAFEITMNALYQNGAIARRVYGNEAWEEWEYINPPMEVGVEYRTTERWKGKTVYAKMVTFDALPNNTENSVWLGVSGATAVVDYSIITRNADGNVFCNAALMSVVTGSWANLNSSGNIGLYITTNTDASHLAADCIVRYTKD